MTVLRSELIVHRATRRSALAYIARFADCLGEQSMWTGQTFVPIHLSWDVVPATSGGFDVVSTTTSREVGDDHPARPARGTMDGHGGGGVCQHCDLPTDWTPERGWHHLAVSA